MGETVEALTEKLKAARKVAADAGDVVADLDRQLQKARNEASGIVGHVLEFTVTRGYGRNAKEVVKRLLVKNVVPGWSGDEARGHYLVASGAVGLVRGNVSINKATDTGPYQPPTTTA